MTEQEAKKRLAAAGWTYRESGILRSGRAMFAFASRPGADLELEEGRCLYAGQGYQARALLVASVEESAKLREVIARAVAALVERSVASHLVLDTDRIDNALFILKEVYHD
jgi:hypothetical protein